jgi:hypothetical protein
MDSWISRKGFFATLSSVFLILLLWGCSSSPREPAEILPKLVQRNPNDPYGLLAPNGKPLEVVGINRFQIYNPENNKNRFEPVIFSSRARANIRG